MARFAFVICLFNALAAVGQMPRQGKLPEAVLLEHYSQEKGLSQGTGYAIAQYDDFMWFATQDGLNRFDGYAFRVFRPGGKRSLNNTIIQALLVDSHGRFWVGTGGGLNLYDKQNEQFDRFADVFRSSHLLDTVSIKRLIEDRQGHIWVMTDERGLFCIDTDNRKISVHFPNDNSLYSICLAPNGDLWVSTYQGVYRYDSIRRKFTAVLTQHQLNTRSLLNTILFDTLGNLWIGTREDGVFMVSDPAGNQRIQHYRQGSTNVHLSSNEVTALLHDRAGRIWIGSRTGGISIYNPTNRTFSYLRHSRNSPLSLAENSIWSLYEDRRGIVWIGFSSHGIAKYDPHRFPFHLIQRDPDNPASSLSDNMIFRLSGQDNTLFAGTGTGGLVQYSIKTGQVQPLLDERSPNNLIGNEVRVITLDTDKTIWLANWRGLVNYDPARRTLRSYPSTGNTKHLYVYAAQLIPDPAGRTTEVWTGGQGGLSRFDVGTKQWKNWDNLPALKAISEYTIRLMYSPDSGRTIWLGTLGHGLIRYDSRTRKIQQFDERNGLMCANIRSMLQEGKTLWVGTDCGLFNLDLVSLRVRGHISEQSADMNFRLPNNVIYGILKDNQGHLWLSSNKGLTRFSARQGILKNYDVSDGLQGNEFNTNVSYRHEDGTLFFGGINGINFFKPNDLPKNTVKPPIRITHIQVLDSVYAPNQRTLTLDYKQNFVDFGFTALNFSNTEKNQYQYQLVGIDPTWVQAQHRRYANYTNLPPGEYVFRVKGSNDDGVWNEQGASISLVIKPPFWATVWFRLVMVALLIGVLYGIYQYRIAQLKNRQSHELAVSIRTQELERQRFSKELHDGVGANLAVLKMYLNSLGSPTVPVDELKKRSLSVLKSSIDDIRSLIHDMHPRSLSELGLVQTSSEMVALINESDQLTVTFESQSVPQKLPESIEINLFRVVQELLQNAVKHANANTVQLHLTYDADTLRLTYHDDGRGFDPSLADHPSGNGLVNIKQRITLLKGEFSLKSSETVGTTVEISVPVLA